MESSVKEVEEHLIFLHNALTKSLSATVIAFNRKYLPPTKTRTTQPSSYPPHATSCTPPRLRHRLDGAEEHRQVGFPGGSGVGAELMTGNPDTKFYWGLSRDMLIREGERAYG